MGIDMKKKGIDIEGDIEKDKKGILNINIKDIKNNITQLSKKLNKPMGGRNATTNKEKKKNVVAFDIGSTTTKIVEGVYYKNKLTIETCIQIKTPANSIEDGVINIKDALVTMIGAALKQYNIKAKDAICTTNSTAIINREILIPKVEEDEMETVVRYEIQQYLPIDLDDCILQMTVLNEEEDLVEERTKLNVRVIAYPKRIALEYYKLLSDLGLKPYALDVNFNALNKFVNIANMTKFEYKAKSSIALLDMGANFIDVNIYKDDKLDFTRRIKAGGNDIDEVLIQNGGFASEDAKKIKFENIDLIVDDSAIKFETKIVKEVLDEWIEKIEMILQFYKNKSVENDIEKIIIFGGSSKFKGLDKYMTDKLGMGVRRLKGVSNIAFKKDEDNDKKLGDFINAIGSVVRL